MLAANVFLMALELQVLGVSTGEGVRGGQVGGGVERFSKKSGARLFFCLTGGTVVLPPQKKTTKTWRLLEDVIFPLFPFWYCFWGHVVLSQHVSMPRPMRRLAQAFHRVGLRRHNGIGCLRRRYPSRSCKRSGWGSRR